MFALRANGLDIPETSRLLRVAHVLEVSVRCAGERLKVRVQLADAIGSVRFETTVRELDPWVTSIMIDPALAPVRFDPRLARLARHLNLAA